MNINEKDYILAMWIVCLPGIRDWMATITRPDGDETKPWRLEYRFRYYNDSKVWGSQDKKSFYAGELDPETSEEKALEAGNVVMNQLMKIGFGSEKEFNEIKGGLDKFIEVCRNSKYMHIKEGKEAEEYVKTLNKES